ncbi:MAG TPA: DUF6223 family protein [Flavitalea sp.]|nr:DUF6223 family protein [Flavitalea sp.]
MNMQNLLQVDLFLQIITTGRLWSIVAAVVGLIGVIVGWMALAHSARRISSRRLMGIVALALGLIGVVLSGLHLARTTGGFGTGKGRAGAIVALVVALIGMVLGRLVLARLRWIATGHSTASMPAREKEHK